MPRKNYSTILDRSTQIRFENLTARKNKKKRMDVFKKNILRRIFGPCKDDIIEEY